MHFTTFNPKLIYKYNNLYLFLRPSPVIPNMIHKILPFCVIVDVHCLTQILSD